MCLATIYYNPRISRLDSSVLLCFEFVLELLHCFLTLFVRAKALDVVEVNILAPCLRL